VLVYPALAQDDDVVDEMVEPVDCSEVEMPEKMMVVGMCKLSMVCIIIVCESMVH